MGHRGGNANTIGPIPYEKETLAVTDEVTSATPSRLSLAEHPLRLALANEVHARPYEILTPPIRASHLALAGGEGSVEEDRTHLIDLLDRFGVQPPALGTNHFSCVLGELRLRWERHTEFSTWTFYRFDPFTEDQAFAQTAADELPRDWLDRLPGTVLVAMHAAIREGDEPPDLHRVFGDHLVVGSRIGGDAGTAWSDFRLHRDGFGRLLVNAGTLTRGQTGRMLQRLLEMETYRMMALLAFPVARGMGGQLSRLEAEVATLTASLAATRKEGDNTDERRLLADITGVAAEVERLMSEHSYRFGASRAYHALVNRSIAELREERIPGSQTFKEFMDRRFTPAMRTCEAMAERAAALGRRIARASDLLRTRVDITLEENNRDLLRSMDRRAQMQLRLQETVEGLSVVAISYYLWGLVAYVLKGSKAAGLPIDPDAAALVAIPLVIALVFVGVRRLRKAVAGRHPEPGE